MQDVHDTKIGIVSDDTQEGTKILNLKTQESDPEFPPLSKMEYRFKSNGLAVLQMEVIAVPCRIEGVIRDVRWIRDYGNSQWMILDDHKPHHENYPVGRRVAFECDGRFASMKPLDEETTRIMSKMPFTSLTWTYENGECQITLQCLAMKEKF